ncbi:MAG: YaiO family outer membrane beta-barrel protein [Gammaproteobacteria bacterium]|nr:YaiO family outer membrane beta-barrel protein [Gammaproteobacteria bacterium]
MSDAARTPWPMLVACAALACAGPLAAQAPPADFDSQFQAARSLALSGQREAALAAYGALLVRSPGNADVLLGRGRLYAWMGRWPESEADLSAATTAAPGYADAWSALGDLYLWSDRPALVVQAYSRWLALSPATDPAALIARARAWRAAGDLAAARADFEAARTRGADGATIDGYVRSLSAQSTNPGALAPDAVAAPGYRWTSSLGGDWTAFSPARPDWSDYTLSVRRHFSHGSLALEALGAERFSIRDHAWALDAYVDLWRRAYANLRYQRGPQQDLFPGDAWRAEVFQGVAHGWELSGSYDRLEFGSGPTSLYGLGIGRYVGNWYLRWRHLYIPGNLASSDSDRFVTRYYYAGDADNYAELAVGFGYTDTAALPTASGSRHSWSASAAWVRFLRPRLGFRLGAALDHGDDGYDGRGLFATVYTRW